MFILKRFHQLCGAGAGLNTFKAFLTHLATWHRLLRTCASERPAPLVSGATAGKVHSQAGGMCASLLDHGWVAKRRGSIRIVDRPYVDVI